MAKGKNISDAKRRKKTISRIKGTPSEIKRDKEEEFKDIEDYFFGNTLA